MTYRLDVEDLGRVSYAGAYEAQRDRHARVLADRDADPGRIGTILLVEHDPVVTVTRRPEAAGHVLVNESRLAELGVSLEQTDRGGDVTYHGPGQLVVYPIVDLNRLNCRIVEYLRLLEDVVIAALAGLGIHGHRDPSATGVWVRRPEGTDAKVCAMGVRVRRWVTMHGLALNVRPNLEHFDLIVPCGLANRSVTSLEQILGDDCPSMADVKQRLVESLRGRFAERAEQADRDRAEAQGATSEPGGSQR